MQSQIISFLKSRQGCSLSEEISAALGIGKQALWEGIQELRQLGYDIVSVPHQGYQLVSVPDRLYPVELQSGLQAGTLGHRIVYLDQAASTMDEALALGLAGALEGTLVVAEAQDRGRGRLGRVWDSPRYQGIYASLIVRPQVSCDAAAVLTLASAVAICEAVVSETGVQCRIKWPNDIMAGGGKLGGILTEMKTDKDRVSFVIIGFGINVNTPPEALVEGAVSLAGIGGHVYGRARLLQQVLCSFERTYGLFKEGRSAEIVQRGRELSATLGRRVSVDLARGQISGEAVDIDRDGGLLVRRESGIVEKVMSGDVVFCR
jgi:BirA family transcriptional regulator, biotin operon repressor / biotin---[acetyl-CoA-carboxylase] ligase